MSNYRKTMGQALQEVYPINEDNIDLMRKAAGGAAQTVKMKDGKLQMDMFTASAIMQVLDKVNPANKKKMTDVINKGTKDGMMKLQDFAMKQIKSENDPEIEEEADLDEATKWKLGDGRPRSGAHIENRRYWDLPKDELQYIIKDAGEAYKLNPTARKATKGPGNWADQVNDATTVLGWRKRKGIKEEADLDEASKLPSHLAKFFDKDGNLKKDAADRIAKGKEKLNIKDVTPKGYGPSEEVDLDEGKMSQLHQLIKDKKSAEEIAKIMKLDVKTVKTLMASHHPEDVEEGAESDARRGMSKDPDFSRKDSADVDDDATDDDVKSASKNIIMQMRKVVSLRGKFDVEFKDRKKVKIPAKIAVAVQTKYNSFKNSKDKVKFAEKIAKSYKSMLSALKENTILGRIGKKIQERKNG